MSALIIYFDLRLHDRMDRFNTLTLRGKVYAYLHYLVHEIAFWISPNRAELSGQKKTKP